MPTPDDPTPAAVLADAGAAPSGKLAMLSVYAVAASWIPLPFVPERVLKRVRGALVHDVGARHGLSFTTDARTILAEPGSAERHRIVRAAETVARQVLRRFVGPFGVVGFAASGLEVYALGLLLDRYVRTVRPHGSVRVQVEEARRVRDAIDRAILRALSPSLRPALTTMNPAVDDLRDELTRWIDALLLTSATVPSYVERRLEAAFDEVAAEMGLARG